MKTCTDIIKAYLKANGYDGLAGCERGCWLDDFAPCCDGPLPDCVPGHTVMGWFEGDYCKLMRPGKARKKAVMGPPLAKSFQASPLPHSMKSKMARRRFLRMRGK